EGLMWLVDNIGVSVGFFPFIIFLMCALVASASGTADGTVAAVTPIMFPLAVGVGAEPGLVVGAILSGAMFGDNIAPISDTTIASALTQESDIADVVKTRLPYALIAGFFTAVLLIIAGFLTKDSTMESIATNINASQAP